VAISSTDKKDRRDSTPENGQDLKQSDGAVTRAVAERVGQMNNRVWLGRGDSNSVHVLVTGSSGGGRTGAAEGGIVAALGAVVLHGIGRLALHDGDLATAVLAGVLGADFGPTRRAFLIGPVGFEFRQLDGFARAADEGHRITRLHGLGFFCGLDATGVPILDTGAGEGGRSGESRDSEQGGDAEGFHDE
jgi:hypothetical protein